MILQCKNQSYLQNIFMISVEGLERPLHVGDLCKQKFVTADRLTGAKQYLGMQASMVIIFCQLWGKIELENIYDLR